MDAKKSPEIPWCRYADDGLAHCKTENEAKQLLETLRKRMEECGIELHPDKTKIIYCKDENRKGKYSNTKFDFLGYTFRCRKSKNAKNNKIFGSFSPAVSKKAVISMRKKIRQLNWRNRTDLSLEEIAKLFNPVLSGWMNYYGKYCRSVMDLVWKQFNNTLVKWAMNKYFKGRKKVKAARLIESIAAVEFKLFVHWDKGKINVFA